MEPTLRETKDMSEHMRFVNNPTAVSYLEEAMATHYRDKHNGDGAHLKFELIRTANNTILCKKFEVYYIYSYKPEINNKSEVQVLHRFLVNGNVILIN